jgi:hypothetical protein
VSGFIKVSTVKVVCGGTLFKLMTVQFASDVITQIHIHDDFTVGGKSDRRLAPSSILWGKLSSFEILRHTASAYDDDLCLIADMGKVDPSIAQSKLLHILLPP